LLEAADAGAAPLPASTAWLICGTLGACLAHALQCQFRANNIVIRMATGIPRAYTAEQPINVAMERQKNSGVASRTQKNWRKTK
jgi:hypothetical protein